jgi:hypothetical protein
LENEDAVRVANNGRVYQSWSWDGVNRRWEGLATATKDDLIPAADPESHQLSRDSVTWVTRSSPSEKPFFIIGQYSPEDVKITVGAGEIKNPLCTLIPNPSLQSVNINDYQWGENPLPEDQIRVINEKEAPILLFWYNGKWVTWFVGENNVPYLSDDVAIPAGHGFWYHRCGGAFELKLPASKPYEE